MSSPTFLLPCQTEPFTLAKTLNKAQISPAEQVKRPLQQSLRAHAVGARHALAAVETQPPSIRQEGLPVGELTVVSGEADLRTWMLGLLYAMDWGATTTAKQTKNDATARRCSRQ